LQYYIYSIYNQALTPQDLMDFLGNNNLVPPKQNILT